MKRLLSLYITSISPPERLSVWAVVGRWTARCRMNTTYVRRTGTAVPGTVHTVVILIYIYSNHYYYYYLYRHHSS